MDCFDATPVPVILLHIHHVCTFLLNINFHNFNEIKGCVTVLPFINVKRCISKIL